MHGKDRSVVLFVNDDFTSSRIFSPLLSAPNVKVELVVFDANVSPGRRGIMSGAIELLKKISTKYWLYQAFLMTCYKLASWMPSRCSSHKRIPTLRQLCRKNNIPYFSSSDFNSESIIGHLKEIRPDTLLIRCSQIIKQNIIDSVKGEIYCVHSSLLPSYKGIAAEFHALSSGSEVLGTTIFKVVKALDKGPIVTQSETAVVSGKSHFWHVMRNNDEAAQLVKRQYSGVSSGDCHVPNKYREESYFSWPKKDDVRKFNEKGGVLITCSEIIDVLCSVVFGGRKY